MKHGGHHDGNAGNAEWELLSLTVGCPGQTVDLNVAYVGPLALTDAVIDRRIDGGEWVTDFSTSSLPILLIDGTVGIGETVEYRVKGRIDEVVVTDSAEFGPIVNEAC